MKGYNKFSPRSILRRWLGFESEGIFTDERFEEVRKEIEKLKNTHRNFVERYDHMQEIQKFINTRNREDIQSVREEMFIEKENDIPI